MIDSLRDQVRLVLRTLTFKDWRRAARHRKRVVRALAKLERDSRLPTAPRHGLPSDLIVSLTSYPGRFGTLHHTIQSLLCQSILPDKILLWIAEEDYPALPADVKDLEGSHFAIRTCEDLRNFKKILPTRTAFPNAFILICDDDTYYPRDWLKSIVDHFDPAAPAIVCTRAHQVKVDCDGAFLPYRSWPRNVDGDWTAGHRRDLLPTGNGGVLYPPGSLPETTLDRKLIGRLSATSDDVWLFFMGREAGFSVSRVPGRKREFLEWPNSQTAALWVFHRLGKKDEHLRDAARHFGFDAG